MNYIYENFLLMLAAVFRRVHKDLSSPNQITQQEAKDFLREIQISMREAWL